MAHDEQIMEAEKQKERYATLECVKSVLTASTENPSMWKLQDFKFVRDFVVKVSRHLRALSLLPVSVLR